jgi:hypothetical protein
MTHLTPEQFVDIADGVLAEGARDVAPHLSMCAECRRQLADMRAIMTEAANGDIAGVPEPSPLFWSQLSARVRDAVANEARPRSWRERVLQPWVLVPSFAAAIAVALFVVLLSRPAIAPGPLPPPPSIIQTTAIPAGAGSLPALERSQLLGTADDPQLRLVADYSSTLSWDEMRDEIALTESDTSSDAVLDVLTVDEQRELQRLLAVEMARLTPPENRS